MRPAPEPSPPAAGGSAPSTRPAGLASNGAYRVLLDAAGRGASAWANLQLTGGANEHRGLRVHLRDTESGRCWLLGEQSPRSRTAGAVPRFESGSGAVRLAQRGEGLDIAMELWVDPARSMEVRQLLVRNEEDRRRRIEVTTFAEIVLHDPAAHLAHPVFSKLFLQTEWAPPNALLVHRRPRSAEERFPWLVHAMLDAPVAGFETDRMRLLGRGRRPHEPMALTTPRPGSGRAGNVLDPALSLHTVLELGPREESSAVLLLGVGEDRESALRQVEELSTPLERERSHDDAIARERARQASLELGTHDASRLQTLAVAMLTGQPSLRADASVLARARGGVADVERLGLSASKPLVFLDAARLPRALPATLRAHAYWRALGLPVQLAVATSTDVPAELAHALDDGIRLFQAGTEEADRVAALASWYVRSDVWPDLDPSPSSSTRRSSREEPPARAARRVHSRVAKELLFRHEHGGFSTAGDEYVIHLRRQPDGTWTRPPLPWINVIANERMGTLWSETGAGSTWSRNSREHRLTPWLNDPVLDPHAEALHLRDDDTGAYWSAWPGPTPGGDAYEIRHGFGYTRCVHRSHGLEQEAWVFVPVEDPVRLIVLNLRNVENQPRKISLFSHADLVLGTTPQGSARTVLTEHDAERDVLVATNPMAGEFRDGVVFATAVTDVASARRRCSSDRTTYVGLESDLTSPRTLAEGLDLLPRFGANLDPCFTQQLSFTLAPGAQARIGLLLGEVSSRAELDVLLERYASPALLTEALERVRARWRERLGSVKISTPSRALDLMVNGWLTYQTVACRLWARSAFYQSGGAFGFRDQLQDAVALVALWPQLAREQILRHAAHQFVEGDVLHWWHPPRSRGLRTRFADDLLWLPYLTAHYLQVTGDEALLEEPVPFLRARPLAAGEDETFLAPEPSGESGTMFDHCLRAIDRSLAVGAHGLPLFGSGDWNDGMNRVGREGRGESVWMGFFLYTILGEWASRCEVRGDADRAMRYRSHRGRLHAALNDAGWDGQWYRRGYYDDGAPLGSCESDECQIDALAQAWSVLSQAAPPERAEQAMTSVEQRLVNEDDGIVRLLTPPFENTPHDPGYIKGYVAGVRENGGQYTHAALWVVRAMVELGRRDTAMRLLDMLNPAHQARDDENVRRYQVEPYVVAADVYGAEPHVGRGGWTWYTGSSGWMLRVALESILGVRVEDGRWLVVDPRIPDDWPGYRMRLRPLGLDTTYEIEVQNPDRIAQAVITLRLDGHAIALTGQHAAVELHHDGGLHRVVVVMGRTRTNQPPLQHEGATP